MKIACVSDLHGKFPEIPDCDLLLLGGDYCPVPKNDQFFWFTKIFKPWIDKLSERMKIIGVAGNHDYLFELQPHLVPKMNWIYLQDSGCEFNGLNFWGTPWQPRFYDWAFNLDEPELKYKWGLIPEQTDVLLLHGPPRGFGDFSTFGNEHCGSISLLDRIKEIKPKLVIAGHIHNGYGKYDIDGTIFLNCSYLNDEYVPTNAVHLIEL